MTSVGADSASSTAAWVGAATFAPIALPAALERSTTLVGQRHPTRAPTPRSCPSRLPSCEPAPTADAPLSQAGLWCTVADHLRPGDIVLADQGTAFYGMGTQRLPPDVTFLGQPLWASIGYTLPALLGACAACPGRRGVVPRLDVPELLATLAHAASRANGRTT